MTIFVYQLVKSITYYSTTKHTFVAYHTLFSKILITYSTLHSNEYDI